MRCPALQVMRLRFLSATSELPLASRNDITSKCLTKQHPSLKLHSRLTRLSVSFLVIVQYEGLSHFAKLYPCLGFVVRFIEQSSLPMISAATTTEVLRSHVTYLDP